METSVSVIGVQQPKADEHQSVTPIRRSIHKYLKAGSDFFELNNALAAAEGDPQGESLSAQELRSQLRLKRWEKMRQGWLALHFVGWPFLTVPTVAEGVYVQRVEDELLKHIVEIMNGDASIDKAFFFRKPGKYPLSGTGRVGSTYHYTIDDLEADIDACRVAARRYLNGVHQGRDELHSKMLLPQNVRANFHIVGTFEKLWAYFEVSKSIDTGYEVQSLARASLQALKEINPAFGDWFENLRDR
jgi:hypothetical protein